MNQVFEAFGDLITDHWIKFVVAVGFTSLGWLVGWQRTARYWRQREFYHRINFSLNSIIDGVLRIRTLTEKSCEDVFLNKSAVQQLTAAAQKTKPGLPLIPLPEDDRWHFLNAALNEMSEQFAHGLIAHDMGKDVTRTEYLICLTSEADGDVRTRKIRALVTRKDLLQNLPAKRPKFESDHHHVRWESLMYLANEFAQDPSNFLTMEIIS